MDRNQCLILFPYVDHTYRLNSKESLKSIITGPAYKDMQPRLLPGIGKVREAGKLNPVFDKLTESFKKYFESDSPKSEQEFDEKHKELCELVQKELHLLGFKQFQYGQAQKLINMSFKNFYCFDDAADKEKHFTYCHIPIDSRILNEFLNKSYNKRFSSKSVWSKMDYVDYKQFQDSLRNYLISEDNKRFRHPDNTPFSPLEVVFYIWAKDFCINDCSVWIDHLESYVNFTGWNVYQNTKDLKEKLMRIQCISETLQSKIDEHTKE